MKASEAILKLSQTAAQNAFRVGVARDKKTITKCAKAEKACLHGVRVLTARLEKPAGAGK